MLVASREPRFGDSLTQLDFVRAIRAARRSQWLTSPAALCC